MAFDLRPMPRLAERRAHAVAVAIVSIALAAGLRVAMEQLVPGLLPFLFTVPAVIGAALLAGSLAGWLALAGCQLLTLAFVLPHWIRDDGARPQEMVNLALATVSLAVVVWATSAYRRLQLSLRHQCEREVSTLSLLVNEIDHRTKNNFQIAAALLHAQGSASGDPLVADELNAAAGRLVSIAAIYGRLSDRRPDGEAVPLLEHIGEICAGLRAGLLPAGVTLTVTGEELAVPATPALTIGLVVNEWVTNAAKYAFPKGRGTIGVRVAPQAGGLAVEVRDDGVGLPAKQVAGTGSRLLASLVEALGGRVERHDADGTLCRLVVPLPQGA